MEGVWKGLVKNVCDEYYSHLEERGLVRSESDSDGPDSSEGAKPGPSTDEMTSLRSKVNASVRKYGAHKLVRYKELLSIRGSLERIPRR